MLPVIVSGLVFQKFLFGLFAKISCVNQKEDAFGIRKLEQAVNEGAGRKCLARPGRHLN